MTEPGPAIPPDGNEKQPSQERLRADIERNREEFGETVDALAARLDVKTRVKEGAAGGLRSARQAGTRAGQRAGQRARRLGTEARRTTAAADAPKLVLRGGTIVVVAAGAGLGVVWLRRRAARRRTPWRRAVLGVQRTGADVGELLRDQAHELVSKARESEPVTKAVDRSKVTVGTTASRAREAADSPAAGAGATIVGLLLLSLLRRRIAARRATGVAVSEGTTPPSPAPPS